MEEGGGNIFVGFFVLGEVDDDASAGGEWNRGSIVTSRWRRACSESPELHVVDVTGCKGRATRIALASARVCTRMSVA